MNEIAEVQRTLGEMKKQFDSILPAQIPSKRFLRTATMAIENNPELLEAERKSLYYSCQKAAQDGLILDGREAALVVYNSKQGNSWVKMCQYQPMVGGILKKVRNTGQISTIGAYVVYENDKFSYWIDEKGPHLEHNPCLKGPRGLAYLAYATVTLKDGSTQIEVMTEEQIEKVRLCSRSGSDKKTGQPIGIWKSWPEEMWKKTVLRRLCKYLPSSSELDNVFESDNQDFVFQDETKKEHSIEKDVQKNKSAAEIVEATIIDDAIPI